MGEHNSAASVWSSKQAYGLGLLCLMMGMSVGYVLRGSSPVKPQVQQVQPAQPTQATQPAMAMPAQPTQAEMAMTRPTPQQLKHMADKRVEPLMEKLRQNGSDPVLLAQIGNAYYDAQQLPTAIDYYQRSLSIDPKQVNVRTDMASAFCRSGQVERGIKEFETVLKYDPAHDTAYLNMGLIKWQVQHDAAGAIKAWRQLLAHNPKYGRRAQLEQMIAQLERVTVAKK